jgi:hypothetical protein
MIDTSATIVKDQPSQAIRACFLTQGQNAFLRFPLDAFGMNFGRGRQDRERRLQAISDLAIEVNPGRHVDSR